MPLPPLYGHEAVRGRLAGAIASGRLPQSLLLEGPQGVGKQRLALWLAQALLCEQEGGSGAPCGTCRPCLLVVGLGHPDVHWFVPVEPSKKSGDADKQVELVEEALAEEVNRRRTESLYEPPSGLAAHGIAAVRLLLRRLALTPAMAGMKVFIVGDAERLIPQVGSDQAANALLKALEEPPHDTQFVLTAQDPEALLPTVLSRVVRVRLHRLSDSVVTAFAQNELSGSLGAASLAQNVTAADGCPGRLIAKHGGGGTGGGAGVLWEKRAEPVATYALALAQRPFEARGGFSDMLDGLLDRLRGELRAGGDTGKLMAAIAQVMDAREMAQGNVNPQLLTAVLAEELSEGS